MAKRTTPIEAGAVDQNPLAEELRKRSQARDIWRRLKRNKIAMLGMVMVLVLLIAAVFAPIIAPYDPAAQDLT